MKQLQVDLLVPIYSESLIGTPELTFLRWFPDGEQNAIHTVEDGVQICLWFDQKCLHWVHRGDTHPDLSRQRNVLVDKVWATIKVSDVPDVVAAYMVERKNNRSPEAHEIEQDSNYKTLGDRLYRVLLKRVNRLIGYARTVKNQFWLLEHEIDVDRAHGFWSSCNAQGRIDDSEWFRFLPGSGDTITISLQSESQYINESEWPQVVKHVQNNGRISLVNELLSGAERLGANGFARSALTESVAALEVAVSTFAKSAIANEKLSSMYSARISTARLDAQVDRLGFTNTVSYLLPLVVPESVLPTDVLKECQAAIVARQNVIHNGQRDVPNVNKHIHAIRRCCEILDAFGGTNPKQVGQVAVTNSHDGPCVN